MTAPSWLIAKPIAHRGLHDKNSGIIENSISAADAAIAAGFAIECDVQDTQDGDAVVFHDFTLDRLTSEAGPVRERRAAELAGIGLSGSRSDRIPTLSAFLGRIGGRVPLVVEIKSRFDNDMALTRRVCDIVAAYTGPLAIKSFDPAVIATVHATLPQAVRGIVAESHYTHPTYDFMSRETKHALANLLHFGESQPQFLSWHVNDLPTAAPYLCRLLGHLPVMAWTVRTPEDRQSATKHADQMVFEGFRP
jgi:glycerophosphoryl diester phosphodiesterase